HHVLRQLRLVRRRVTLAAGEPVLLVHEEDDAHRASRRRLEHGDQPARLHRHRNTRAVVVGAGGQVPGIEVRAQQHHLFGPLAAAGGRGGTPAAPSRAASLGPCVRISTNCPYPCGVRIAWLKKTILPRTLAPRAARSESDHASTISAVMSPPTLPPSAVSESA